jgi:hypothetical protein
LVRVAYLSSSEAYTGVFEKEKYINKVKKCVFLQFNEKKKGGEISFATLNFSKWGRRLPPTPLPMKWD